jgi:thymidylate synthase ThyX
MAGTLRSWIHYIDVRAEAGTQKEHRLVAESAKQQILEHFPSLEEYWNPHQELIELMKDVVYTPPVMKKPWWRFWR